MIENGSDKVPRFSYLMRLRQEVEDIKIIFPEIEDLEKEIKKTQDMIEKCEGYLMRVKELKDIREREGKIEERAYKEVNEVIQPNKVPEEIQKLLKGPNKKEQYEKINKTLKNKIKEIITIMNNKKYFNFKNFGIINEHINYLLKLV